ncbi:MAG: hypothetical protein A3F82_10525 [Deltaproteobacteria bacterium RIFCSPLOWO2_12_FULL_44_12]|nr:MAG: hypothetical protein A2712_07545 [Deltaproteobacteria bacterium RIFCSPHIGHO2_01_FULL_43_49]OGQ14803.1 MAG: hypothetical protein A3D22_09450 [Deltaproteobacteria bacterium RIFCSPHIGHO2_02_FULL_44_53]OGQ28189.1 MAG: hypothetical protein A3D98_08160 [Deltaproteobacteria bacterium RIFCSPHIGHO2_12_FULL_44_21]OGQ31401.1 MAG: hypothetical protein A2979_08210 [Deltaproteobacteria bacterium RIFCSPLOWO2_01_FULL_45_74]OGQ43393.1 MAG: hypothetical protein A3I70_01870 [Deltaproteobacteria bacterium 
MTSSKNIKKAFLFAAGLGERLKPLTEKNPKPLLPLGNRPIIDYSLSYLKKFGVEEVVINLHYLGEKIEQHVGDGKKYGLKIRYSHEEKLLGTAGGLKKVESHFKNEEAFFTLNSDTLINCDLNELSQFHAEQKSPATLVVAPWQEGYTRLQVGNKRLLNIDVGDHLFTGLTVLSPPIFSTLSEKPSNLILDGIAPLMQKVKAISAFVHEGYWRDIGSKESYQLAQEEWAVTHHNRLA